MGAACNGYSTSASSGKCNDFLQFFRCLRLDVELGMRMESFCPSVMLVCSNSSKGNVGLQSREFSFKVHASGRAVSVQWVRRRELKSDNTAAKMKLERSRIGPTPCSCSIGIKGVMKSEL